MKKFAELSTFGNVFENFGNRHPILHHQNKLIQIKGKWHSHYFKNKRPISVELACGGGEYTIEMARRFPKRNFIGVDIKGNRIWKGAKQAIEKNLNNVAFLRTRIEFIEHFFDAGEVDEIWITFPDPFPKKENRRLTALNFLEQYEKILKPHGLINLKTDDENFFNFSKSVAESLDHAIIHRDVRDVHQISPGDDLLSIKTKYELMHIQGGKKIKYLSYQIS